MTDDLSQYAAGSADRVDLWRRILAARTVARMTEIGVWRGEFAAAILRDCPTIAEYFLVDPWRTLDDWNKPMNVPTGEFERVYRAAMDAIAFAGERAVVLRGTTLDVAARIPDASLDAVYVDGDHTLRGITIDLVRMLPKLKPGGLLGGDDFLADPWHHGPAFEPTLVAPFAVHFAEAMGLPFVALPFRQYAIVNRPSGFSFTNLSGVAHSRRIGRPGRTPNALTRAATRLLERLQPRRG